MSTTTPTTEIPKVSYGRIVRDEQGNVIDIILEEDEGEKEEEEGGVEGAMNPEKDYEPEAVEAKTDVVRCESSLRSKPYPGSQSQCNPVPITNQFTRLFVFAYYDDKHCGTFSRVPKSSCL